MRRTDQQQNHMFSYLSPGMRVRKDHLRTLSGSLVDGVLSSCPGDSTRCMHHRGASVDSAGETGASAVAANVALNWQPAFADGIR